MEGLSDRLFVGASAVTAIHRLGILQLSSRPCAPERVADLLVTAINHFSDAFSAVNLHFHNLAEFGTSPENKVIVDFKSTHFGAINIKQFVCDMDFHDGIRLSYVDLYDFLDGVPGGASEGTGASPPGLRQRPTRAGVCLTYSWYL